MKIKYKKKWFFMILVAFLGAVQQVTTLEVVTCFDPSSALQPKP